MHAPALRIGCALAAALVVAAPVQSFAESTRSTVSGRIIVQQPTTSLEKLGPIVIYLDSDADEPSSDAPGPDAVIHQKNARFAPAFSVVVAGQSVTMVNDDLIYHNVFSYSKPNDFDLGIYAAGKARKVTLGHPGVVKTYCSIHEKMNGTILVTPTAYFAVVEPDGAFEIGGVPPGRYRLSSWCEKLPTATREIELLPGQVLRVEIDLAKPRG